MRDRSEDLRCSFCAKSVDDIHLLIAGPSVHICDQCVDLCNRIIEGDVSRASEVSVKPAVSFSRRCLLCRIPKDPSELRRVRERGLLCLECIEAVQNAVVGTIHHVDITVADMARSTEVYERVLPLMGLRRVPNCDSNPVWAGTYGEVGLQPARTGPGRSHDRYSPGLHHLAFAAPTREAVDGLFLELDRLGVRVLDPPAQYDHYAPGYYAVFFADPDGVKLEYVFTPEWPV